MNKSDLLKKLDLPDAFENFAASQNSVLWGWNGDLPLFGELIRETRPRLILEVGSWLGQSTSTMAKELKAQHIDASIIAIDTWLGSLEHRTQHDLTSHLGLQNGFPTLYPRFLSNMLNASCADKIVPLPLPSSIAARYLASRGIEAELVYIDGSHDEQDVYNDVNSYWNLLATGGIMFGDDWNLPSVRTAVERFCSDRNIGCESLGSNWRIQKSA